MRSATTRTWWPIRATRRRPSAGRTAGGWRTFWKTSWGTACVSRIGTCLPGKVCLDHHRVTKNIFCSIIKYFLNLYSLIPVLCFCCNTQTSRLGWVKNISYINIYISYISNPSPCLSRPASRGRCSDAVHPAESQGGPAPQLRGPARPVLRRAKRRPLGSGGQEEPPGAYPDQDPPEGLGGAARGRGLQSLTRVP